METTPIATQALPAGIRLEEFVIESVLGSGGFGITYLARDTALGRQVVIKENLPVQFCFRDPSSLTVAPRHSQSDDADNFQWSLENFSKEAAMLASLHHPGIVQVLRSFQAFGTAFFVMPYVEGVTLDELLVSRREQGQAFSEEELRGMLERTLNALAHLHDRGIYHRDIKPGNILITRDGIPVLIDFGSARQRLSERSMTVVESAGYTPFEQLQSRGNVGPWSDLYALGATLEKILTGAAPPKAMDRMREDPRMPLFQRNDLKWACSREFLQCIDKALIVDESKRWQDAGEWLAGLPKESSAEVAASKLPPPASAPMSGPVTAPEPFSLTVAIGTKRNGKPVPWVIAVCLVLSLLIAVKVITAIASSKFGSRTVAVTDNVKQPQPDPFEMAEAKVSNSPARTGERPDMIIFEQAQKKREYSVNPSIYITGSRWADADYNSRSEFAGKISKKIRGLYSEDKSAKVRMNVMREGKVVEEEVPLYDDKGNATPEGNDYFGKIDSYLHTAAAHPTGGIHTNPYSGERLVDFNLNAIREEPLRNPIQFSDVTKFEEDVKNGFDEGGENSLNFSRYAKWRNEKTDRPIHPNDADARKAFDDQHDFSTFDPASFGADEKMRVVGGFPKFNEKFYKDPEGVLRCIVGLKEVSQLRKQKFWEEFKMEAMKSANKK